MACFSYSNMELNEILKDVISEENIIDPVIDIKEVSNKGKSFQSFMSIVNVKGSNKELSLILKRAPRDAKTRNMLHTEIFFAQEIYFYNKVLPAFEAFQKDKGVENPFDAFPKCYKIVDTPGEELIVLENLNEHGFSMTDCKVKLDERHVSLVLREYGRFHAVSYALKDQKPELFNDVVKGFLDVFSLRTTSMDKFDVILECAQLVKELYAGETNLNLKESVDGIKGGILPFLKKLDDFPKEDGIIVHGDGWCNNIMFMYESQLNFELPRKLCFVDFQISKVVSPVIDLSFFLYSSASNEILDDLENYLRIYHESFQSHLKILGSDADELYPLSKLMDDWKEYGKYGFIMSLLMTRIMLCEADDVKDFGDVISEDKTPTDVFIFKNKNEELINERLKYLVMHMYENGYL